MVSFRTLPLPGAHITTLTSLADFKPAHSGMSQAHSLSSSEYEDEHIAAVDLTEYDMDEADAGRQVDNLHSANQAYDMAMATLADENPGVQYNPQWPSAVHASHASFEDWAASSHDIATSAPFRSQDAFTFSPDIQKQHSMHNGLATPVGQNSIQSIWQSSMPASEAHAPPVNVQAAQQSLQDFLIQTGLDAHLELKTKLSKTLLDLEDANNVNVQTVLPCGRFLRLQLS